MSREHQRSRHRTQPTARVSATGLLGEAVTRLRRHPEVVWAFLLAGVVVAGVDWLRLADPVPTTAYATVQDGELTVTAGVMVAVTSQTSLGLSALWGLKLPWLAVTVGLELLALATVTGASVFGLGRLLDVEPSPPAAVRYGLVLAVFWMPTGGFDLEPGLFPVALVLIVVFVLLVARLLPVPGRLVLGEGFGTALHRSWACTTGHTWAVFGAVLAVGVGTHLATSVPVVGPVGSSLFAALHAGVVAALLAHTDPVAGPDPVA